MEKLSGLLAVLSKIFYCVQHGNSGVSQLMGNKLFLLVVLISPVCISCSNDESIHILTTIADARDDPAQIIDVGKVGDSVGDVLTFDQPLLDEDGVIIGNNSGICVRIQIAQSFQCQWTLTFIDNGDVTGTVQIAGKEFDQGVSVLTIVGGSGKYFGIRGELQSTNNNDGTFTQVLRFKGIIN